ncbi:MAG: DUF721 domain-containing protein [Candidatus Cloacimonadota bacterium]|nr:DUF721 domain-containing protein [Candidatus Cloacimonadota bacterium]
MKSFTRVNSIFSGLINNFSKQGFSREIKIALLWNRAVGSLLNRKSRIVKLEHNTLFVLIENNVWLQELLLNKSEIKAKINKNLSKEEKISEIIFSLSSKKISLFE